MKDARAVGLLVVLMSDQDDKSVRDAAKDALAGIGEPAVIPLLAARCGTGFRAESAQEVLTRLSLKALRGLRVALESRNSLLRRSAAEFVGNAPDAFRGTLLGDSLIAVLSDEDREVRLAATLTLGRLGEDRPPLVQNAVRMLGDLDRRTRQVAAQYLQELDEEWMKREDVRATVPLLLTSLNASVFWTEAATSVIESLYKIDPDWTTTEAARGFLVRVIRDCRESGLPEVVKNGPLARLLRMPGVEAATQLLREGDLRTTTVALNVLETYGDAAATLAIIPAYREYRIEESRDSAAFEPLERVLEKSIQNVSDEDLNWIAELRDVVGSEQEGTWSDSGLEIRTRHFVIASGDRVKRMARVELARRAWNVAEASLQDPSPDVRQAAVTALGRMEGPVDRILKVLEDGAPVVRIAAVKALARRCDSRSIEPLRKVLEDQHGGVRQEAARVLKKLDPRSRAHLNSDAE